METEQNQFSKRFESTSRSRLFESEYNDYPLETEDDQILTRRVSFENENCFNMQDSQEQLRDSREKISCISPTFKIKDSGKRRNQAVLKSFGRIFYFGSNECDNIASQFRTTDNKAKKQKTNGAIDYHDDLVLVQ